MKLRFLFLALVLPWVVVAQNNTKTSLSKGSKQKVFLENSGRSISNSEYHIKWLGARETSINGENKRTYLTFEGAVHNFSEDGLPVFVKKRKVNGNPNNVEIAIINASYEDCTSDESKLLQTESISSEVNYSMELVVYKKETYAELRIVPLRRNQNTGRLQRLVAFDIEWNIPQQKGPQQPTVQAYADNSVLANGEWYKLGVVESGVHVISYSKLKAIGIDPDEIDPRNIRIYGNGGGMLPMENSEFRYDDLEENSIQVVGESDGIFNSGDYVLFYGQSQDVWTTNGVEYTHEKNLFSDTTFYFLTASLGTGKRISNKASISSYNVVVTSFDEHIVHEQDRTNLIKTGQDWYGEQFGVVNTHDFSFNISNIDNSVPADIEIDLASHSPNQSSEFVIDINSQTSSVFDNSVVPGYANTYADKTNFVTQLQTPPSNINIEINFNEGNTSSLAWLNYIEIEVRRFLKMSGNQMHYRDLQSVDSGNEAQFQIQNASSTVQVWDITDPLNPTDQQITFNSSTITYNSSAATLRQYIAFDGNYFYEPINAGQIDVQNLHATKEDHPQFIIVTHPKFKEQAEELATFHADETREGLSYVVATTNEIYNEFSSGAQDINAIRGFVKMYYDEAATAEQLPKYLLLFGDGSYDYKDRISGNSNYVPVYQSKNSVDPTSSYCSDDFYGLLDDSEGQGNSQYIDIGIGRLPVRTRQEAIDQVNKIKRYYSMETLKPWRNWLLFIGDDEDNDIHMRDMDRVAKRAAQVNPNMNLEKIYLDAYDQVSGAGGERYPEAQNDFNSKMDQGTLMVTYMGHGGELGWAHERILEVPQINAWENEYKLPLFLTATCEFSRYDDPQRTAAGEFVLINPKGGAIALLTTTRLVYSSGNYALTDNFYEFGFSQLDSGVTTLGDLVEVTKVNTASDANSRKFNLLGDPALTLAIPEFKVVTTSLPDTMKALEKVTVTGYVADDSGQKMDDFNGVIYPSVFDKSKVISTLNNDDPNDTSYFQFDLQTDIIFKGKASVNNGDFQFTFVVPKDISLDYGNGRISYYAENDFEDAAGSETDFLLGGYNPNAAIDEQGPDVDVYMNDETFVFGGLTDENPDMLAKIFDENGINTSGNGVGHDLVAVLDENTTESIVLNEYYEAELDDYQRGTIEYPFSDLEEGKHTLRVKVWDVYNNSSEGNTEFIVAESAELALDHVLNYPNPFTTNTSFYFEHNQPGQGLDVKIEIFTVSGRLIKTLKTFTAGNSYRVGPIQWDGLDEFGDPIGKGVYVYKVEVSVPSGESVDHFEKLVILN